MTPKIVWLKRLLLAKSLTCLFIWGLPALVGPPAFLALFGISMPADPIYLRIFGAMATALALLYWFAYQDPIRNSAIIKYAIFDNGLSTLTVIGVAIVSGLSSWFFYVSGAMTAFFTIAFYVLRPKE